MDGGVSVFPDGVSKWMVVFPDGWWCFGVSRKCFGVSRKWMVVFPESVSVFPNGWWCFQMDGGVSVFRVVFPESVSKWMVVFRCFQKVFPSGWWCFQMDGNVGGVSSKSVSKRPKVDGGVDGGVSGVSKRCFQKWMVVFPNGWWCFGVSKHLRNIH